MEKIRSFISFDIPMMPAVEDARVRLRGIPGVSVPKEVHLTLRFLGDVEAKKIEELSSGMRSLERYRSFSVSLKGLGAFPNNKDPRVIWIGAEPGAPFYDILSDLDGILSGSSVDYDKKPFKAHVTVGRVKRPSAGLTALLNECRDMEAGSFECRQIFLMSSLLTSGGAEHSVIDTFRLADG
ncbi:MAG: RNA 2',3'-cyclic phosphodiesterase [Methanomassiliicoccaceae archaeon]|nr:RNA 2',3'-cyclic phosphodiesterase [Methanomassiliicoccaceae archaeon]